VNPVQSSTKLPALPTLTVPCCLHLLIFFVWDINMKGNIVPSIPEALVPRQRITKKKKKGKHGLLWSQLRMCAWVHSVFAALHNGHESTKSIDFGTANKFYKDLLIKRIHCTYVLCEVLISVLYQKFKKCFSIIVVYLAF
jgi:hypothetical protein